MGPNVLREEWELYQDGSTLADMVVFLEVSDVGASGQKIPQRRWWYTCRHYDKATGNCGIYDERPATCSEYPYGVPCLYTDCTWDKGRAGTHPEQPSLVKLGTKIKELVEEHPRTP